MKIFEDTKYQRRTNNTIAKQNRTKGQGQTLVEWSLDGPLPKLCPVIPISNQDDRQAKNRKKGG
jgi:hypothetical protein